jgi:hypothetical protein
MVTTTPTSSGIVGKAIGQTKLIITGDISQNPDVSGGAESLGELQDVDVRANPPTFGDYLAWDAVNLRWTPKEISVSGTIKNLSDVDSVTSPTANDVLIWNSTNNVYTPVEFSVENLTDTYIPNTPQQNNVLSYNSYLNKWEAKPVTISTSLGQLFDVDFSLYPKVPGYALVWKGDFWGAQKVGSSDVSRTKDLIDVSTSPPAPNQVLKWNASLNQWVPGNVSISGGINQLSDVDTQTIAPQQNYALVWNGSNWIPKKVVLEQDTTGGETTTPLPTGEMVIATTAINTTLVTLESPAPETVKIGDSLYIIGEAVPPSIIAIDGTRLNIGLSAPVDVTAGDPVVAATPVLIDPVEEPPEENIVAAEVFNSNTITFTQPLDAAVITDTFLINLGITPYPTIDTIDLSRTTIVISEPVSIPAGFQVKFAKNTVVPLPEPEEINIVESAIGSTVTFTTPLKAEVVVGLYVLNLGVSTLVKVEAISLDRKTIVINAELAEDSVAPGTQLSFVEITETPVESSPGVPVSPGTVEFTTSGTFIYFVDPLDAAISIGDLVLNTGSAEDIQITSINLDRDLITVNRAVAVTAGDVLDFAEAVESPEVGGTEELHVVASDVLAGTVITFTTPIDPAVDLGYLLQNTGNATDPEVTFISTNRLSITVSDPVTVSTGDQLGFAQIVEEEVAPPAEIHIVAFDATSTIIQITEPALEEVVPGLALLGTGLFPEPVVSGLSSDRLTITLDRTITVVAGQKLTFGTVTQVSNSGFLIVDYDIVNSFTIPLLSAADNEVAVGNFILNTGLEIPPVITDISQDRKTISISSQVTLFAGDILFVRAEIESTANVDIAFTSLKDVDITKSLLREGQLITWDFASQKWIARDLQIPDLLDGLGDVDALNPSTNDGIFWNEETSLWESGPLQVYNYNLVDFDYAVGSNLEGKTLAWDVASETWKPQPYRKSLDELDDVFYGSSLQTGQSLVYGSGGWRNGTPSISLTDLTNVFYNSTEAGEVLTFNGSQWTSSRPVQYIEDLFDVVEFNTSDPESPLYRGEGYSLVWRSGGWRPEYRTNILEGLLDTDFTTKSDGDFLSWDENSGKWIATNVEGAVINIGIDVLSDVDVTTNAPLPGQVLQWDNTLGVWSPKDRQGATTFIAAENITAGNIVAFNPDSTVSPVSASISTSALLSSIDSPLQDANLQFGKSFDISEDESYIIIGSPSSTGFQGAAYLYTPADLVNPVHTFINPNIDGDSDTDYFGYSCAVSSLYSAVGAYTETKTVGPVGQEVTYTSSGVVYVYDNTSGNLLYTIQNPNDSGTSEGDEFGKNIVLNNTYLIVAAPKEDVIDSQGSIKQAAGVVYIFEASSGSLLRKIVNPEPQDFHQFGSSFSLSEASQYLVISSPFYNGNSGKVYIYAPINGSLLYSLENPNSHTAAGVPNQDYFGFSVALSATKLAVGAYNESIAAPAGGSRLGSGIVYIYDISDGGLLRTILNPTIAGTESYDNFGYSLSLTEERLAVGAPGEDVADGASDTGTVYLFDPNFGTLKLFIQNPSNTSNVGFGNKVSLSASYFMSAAPLLNSPSAISQVGKAYLFDSSSEILTNANDWLGIANSSVSTGEVVEVLLTGSISTNQANLIQNELYYLTQDGSLTTTYTDYGIIGKALSDTDLYIVGAISSEAEITQITDLTDVDTRSTPPKNNQGLVWNATLGLWEPKTIGYSNVTYLRDLIDVAYTQTVAEGQAIGWNGANWTNIEFIRPGTLQLTDLIDINPTLTPANNSLLIYVESQGYWTGVASTEVGRVTLESLNDVFIDTELETPILPGQVLSWNETESRWEPTTVSYVFSMEDLSNVDLSTPALSAQVLAYNEITQTWLPTDIRAISINSIDDLNDVDITTIPPMAGQSLVWDFINEKFIPGDVSVSSASISELQDVNIDSGTLTVGQGLLWDGFKWINSSSAGGGASSLDDLVDVDIAGFPPSEGDLLSWDSSVNKWISSDGLTGDTRKFLAIESISAGTPVAITPAGNIEAVQIRPGNLELVLDNPNATGTPSSDFFGYSTSTDQTYLAIGAPEEINELGGADTGAVYIYDASSFALLRTIRHPKASLFSSNGDRFGHLVSIQGPLVAISAPIEGGAYREGVVYIFNHVTGDLIHEIQNPTTSDYNYYWGYDSLLLTPDGYLVVGQVLYNTSNSAIQTGRVTIFDSTTGNFIRSLAPTLGYGTDDLYFGSALAYENGRLAVGAKGGANYLANVEVFDISTGTSEGVIPFSSSISDASHSSNFGQSLSIYNNILVVGAPRAYVESYQYGGLIQLFRFDTLEKITEIANPNFYSTTSYDYFGEEVRILGNNILVSARGEDSYSGNFTGLVYLIDATTYEVITAFENPNSYFTPVNDGIGDCLELLGNKALVTTSVEEYVNIQDTIFYNSGIAYVFNLNATSNASNWIGFLKESVVENNTASVILPGGVSTAQSGLLPGSNYYLTNTGSIVSTPTDFGIVGKALSNTDLLVTGDIESNTADSVTKINDLSDVDTTSSTPTIGEGLVWNGVSWVPGIVTSNIQSIDDLTDVNTSGTISSGQVLAWNALTQAWEPSQAGTSNVADISDLSDVDTLTNLPQDNQVLSWDALGNKWIPADLPEGASRLFFASADIQAQEVVVLEPTGQIAPISVSSGKFISTILNPEPETSAAFGTKVAASTSYFAVSAPNINVNVSGNIRIDAGKVFVYNLYNQELLYSLVSSIPSSYDLFGQELVISDDYIIVGIPRKYTQSGRIEIFRTNTGTQIHAINNPVADSYSDFGQSIDLLGTRAIVGCPESDTDGTQSGRAYLYDVENGTLLHTFSNPNAYDVVQGDRFGSSVALNNTFIAVSAPTEDSASGTSTGVVYLFSRNNNSLFTTIYNPEAAATGFGESIVINENYLAVSSRLSSGTSGTVFVYDLSNTTAPVYTIVNPNPNGDTVDDFFGTDLAISNDRLVISSLDENSDSQPGAGIVYIYNLSDGSLYNYFENKNSSNIATNDYFSQVSINTENKLVVGAYAEDAGAVTNAGAAYVYDVADTAITSNAGEWIGVAADAINIGTVGEVYLNNSVAKGFLALAPGSVYYVTSTGALTTSATEYGSIGVAISGTELLLSNALNPVSVLSDLTDVEFTSSVVPSSGLVWNGTKWDARYVSDVVSTGDLSDVTISSTPNEGEALLWLSGTWTPAAVGSSNVDVLNDLSDLYITNLQPNQFIQWDDALGRWVNTTVDYAINDLTDVTIDVPSLNKYNILSWSEDLSQWENKYLYQGIKNYTTEDTPITEGSIVSINTEGSIQKLVPYVDPNTPTIYSTSYTGSLGTVNQFGVSVSVSGTLAAVGTEEEQVVILNSGDRSVYRYINSPQANIAFGRSISLQGQYVLIGGMAADNTAAAVTNSGEVYLYDVLTGDLVNTIANPIPEEQSYFGFSVALYGELAVVGAYRAGSSFEGKAHLINVFTGEVIHTFDGPAGVSYAYFGNSVAFNGTYIAIGAYLEGNGAAYLYRYNSETQEVSLINKVTPAYAGGAQFGYSVAVNNKYLAVGAPLADTNSQGDTGRVNIYDVSTGGYINDYTGTSPQYQAGDAFGSSVALHGDNVLVGAPGRDQVNPSGFGYLNVSGGAYYIDAVSGNTLYYWLNPYYTSGRFGQVCAVTDDFIIIGSSTDNNVHFIETQDIIVTTPSNVNIIGILNEPIVAGVGPYEVVTEGGIYNSSSPLIFGATYYVNKFGSLTPIETDLGPIGVAISDTELYVSVTKSSGSGTGSGTLVGSIDDLSDVDTTTSFPSIGQALVWKGLSWQPQTIQLELQTIDEFPDVDTTTNVPDLGQGLVWNGSAWVPGDLALTSIDDLPDVDTTTVVPSTGQALVFNGLKWSPADIQIESLSDIPDVNINQNPNNGQVLIWETNAWVPGNLTSTLNALTDTDVANAQTGQYLQYNEGVWEPVNRPAAVAVYPLSTSLPNLADTGSLAFIEENKRLYIYDGNEWLDVNRTNSFYLVRAGSFTGPLEGTTFFQPPQTMRLLELKATIDLAQPLTLVFSVMRNGVEFQQFAIPPGETEVSGLFTSNTLLTTEQISVDIITGSASNLTVKFTYE